MTKQTNEGVFDTLGKVAKRSGLGIASKFSSKAAGKLQREKVANTIFKGWKKYEGLTKQKFTPKVFKEFLKKQFKFSDEFLNPIIQKLDNTLDIFSESVLDKAIILEDISDNQIRKIIDRIVASAFSSGEFERIQGNERPPTPPPNTDEKEIEKKKDEFDQKQEERKDPLRMKVLKFLAKENIDAEDIHDLIHTLKSKNVTSSIKLKAELSKEYIDTLAAIGLSYLKAL